MPTTTGGLMPAPALRATGALAALLLALAGGVTAQLPPGDHSFTIGQGSLTRRYRVHVPAGVAARAPVLLAFHGGGGNAEQFQRTAGLDRVADREKFFVVYPQGTGRGDLLTWNAGECCGSAMTSKVDDIWFVRALVAQLGTRIPIDQRRIYATGHSNGAMMVFRLAREASELIAAIAPVAGAMALPPVRGIRPVPLLYLHSVDDPRAPYDGGTGPLATSHRKVTEVLEFWALTNGCRRRPVEARKIAAKPEHPGQSAELLDFTPCSSGAPVQHWRLHGVGHGWPGAPARGRDQVTGPSTTMIDAAEVVWAFVRQFPR